MRFVLCVLCFVLCLPLTALGFDKGPRVKIVFVSAGGKWCPPCNLAKEHTVPALKKMGFGVRLYDSDKLDASLLNVDQLPTFIVHVDDRDQEAGRIVGQSEIVNGRNATLGQIVSIVHSWGILTPTPQPDSISTQAAAPTPVAREPPKLLQQPGRPGPPAATSTSPPLADSRPGVRGQGSSVRGQAFDLVATLRTYLAVRGDAHSSLAWSFPDEADIVVNDSLTIHRPKNFAAECDFRGDSLTITFCDPLKASGSKAGIKADAEIPRVVIRGNVVSAPDVPIKKFGLDLFHDEFRFVIERNPFEE